MFNKFYKITLLSIDWVPLKENLNFKVVPNIDELIYLDDVKQYYKVINVIHSLSNSKTKGIFLIVDAIDNQKDGNK